MPNILKLAALSTALLISFTSHARTFLNVSYDPTREFYSEYNQAFNQYWQAQGNAPSPFNSLTAAQVNRPVLLLMDCVQMW